VLRPDGVLAVWSYGTLAVADAVDAAVDGALQHFYREVVGPYWPAERSHVEDGYRHLTFPFAELPAPAFSMAVSWDLPHLLGYVRSWSATGRYQAARGHDPVEALARALAPAWGAPERQREVRWPLAMRIGIRRGAEGAPG
jgi:hypothetical protein